MRKFVWCISLVTPPLLFSLPPSGAASLPASQQPHTAKNNIYKPGQRFRRVWDASAEILTSLLIANLYVIFFHHAVTAIASRNDEPLYRYMQSAFDNYSQNRFGSDPSRISGVHDLRSLSPTPEPLRGSGSIEYRFRSGNHILNHAVRPPARSRSTLAHDVPNQARILSLSAWPDSLRESNRLSRRGEANGSGTHTKKRR